MWVGPLTEILYLDLIDLNGGMQELDVEKHAFMLVYGTCFEILLVW